MKMEGPIKITTPIGIGALRIARIEYAVHANSPKTGHSMRIMLVGINDQDLEPEAKELFKLLLANGWVSNPVLSRTIYYDQHTSFHAEEDAKKPSPPQG